MAMPDVPFLEGGEIYLRPLVAGDADGPYPRWFNDAEVCRSNAHHVFPYRVEDARRYIAYANRGRDRLVLAIVHRADNRHIGNIALESIDYINRVAELAIVIGEKSSWGKGYGKEAARLLCDHGFVVLNLNRISAGTLDDNIGFQRIADYLGMVREGRRRRAVYKLGRYVDVVEYGLLRSEFFTRFGRPDGADSAL
jgi:[ribosomal protein S5]-alanine N-acetyltransferase